VLLWRQTGTFDFTRLLQLVGLRPLPLDGLASSPSASTSAPSASRPSSRCTSGCPTPWRADPRLRPHPRRDHGYRRASTCSRGRCGSSGSPPTCSLVVGWWARSPRSSPPRWRACRATSSACSPTRPSRSSAT
jgi:hypothetical protein